MKIGPEAFGVAALFALAAYTGEAADLKAPTPGDSSRPLAAQARASASAWLWRRTDHYLQGRLTQAKNVGAAAARSGQRRGAALLLADWEAAIAGPTDRKRVLRDPQDALPLFRLMTWLDPQFLPGWTSGARVISQSRSPGAVATALAYLREGLQNNPASPAILAEQGYILATRAGDADAGARAFERAIEMGAAVDRLSDWDRDAVLEACRFAALLHRRAGRIDRLAAVLQFGTQAFRDDALLHRLATGPRAPDIAFGRDDAR